MSNDFTGSFDDITPEWFIDQFSTANRIDITQGVGLADSDFSMFVWVNLQSTRLAFDLVERTQLPSFAMLTNSEETRVFVEKGNENAVKFAGRVGREAQSMSATRLFSAIQSQVHVGASLDLSDPDQTERLKTLDRLDVINWYAEETDPEPTVEFGFINLADRNLRMFRGTDTRSASPVFKGMLHG